MTFFEHALYGGALVYKIDPHLFWAGAAIGVLPDIPPLLYAMKNLGFKKGAQHILFDSVAEEIPERMYKLYDFTHSFIIPIVLCIILYFINKNFTILALSYALHIICDIPFHDNRFSTRFLYPITNFHINGFSKSRYLWMHIVSFCMLSVIYYRLFS